MSLSEADLEFRRSFVGSSEIAAVNHVESYSTIHDIWARKVGLETGGIESEALELGNELEDALAQIFVKRTGKQVRHAYSKRDEEFPFIGATPDRLVDGEDSVLEIKLVGFQNLWQWGTGIDAIPYAYLCQVQQEMRVFGCKKAYVGALLASTQFKVYEVPYNPELMSALIAGAKVFWERYVVPQIPPPIDGSSSAAKLLSKLHPRDNGKTISADETLESLALELLRARTDEKNIEERRTLAENRIKDALGDSTCVVGSGWKATWKTNVKGVRTFKFDVKKEVEQ